MAQTKDFFGKLNAPYYVYAPHYQETSGGVRALHYLCHALNLAGEEAYVVTEQTNSKLRTPTLTKEIIDEHHRAGRESIVIYPEIISGNPLGAANVVRFLLNVPGALTGNSLKWAHSDLIYTHGPDIVPAGMSAELLQVPLVNAFIYNSDGVNDAERRGRLLWIHRYVDKGGELDPITSGATEISFRVPKRNPEELAALYRSAELLYTHEQSTACYEAMLCGCPVIYIPNKILLATPPIGYLGREGWAWGLDQDEIQRAKASVRQVTDNYKATQTAFWLQLDKFIERTQTHARQNHAARLAAEQALQTDHLASAIKAYNEADLDTATAHLSGLIGQGSDDPLAYAYLAFICAAQGLTEDAEAFIDQAAQLAPERHDLKAALGETFLKAGRPDEAHRYLEQAIRQQPEMFAAYPALAEALRQLGEDEAAIQLLSTVSSFTSPAQGQIQAALLEMLSRQGNVGQLAELCLRNREALAYQQLGIQLLTHAGAPAERINMELAAYFASRQRSVSANLNRPAHGPDIPLTICFLVSDFDREENSGRLESLLLNLDPDAFRTIVIDNDAQAEFSECAQRASLICDHWLSLANRDEASILEIVASWRPDVLVDLDGFGPRSCFSLLDSIPARLRTSWTELPLTPSGGIQPIQGESLSLVDQPAPTTALRLAGTGEFCALPNLPILANGNSTPTRFACLVTANRVSSDSWLLFAKVLGRLPESTLSINLGELGDEAKRFIAAHFAEEGVSAERLHFIHAKTVTSLCEHWNAVDVGLAPLHGNGDHALSTALWMGRPYLALDSNLTWSRRPAALLRQFGLAAWIANDIEAYLNLASQAAKQASPLDLRQKLRNTTLTNPQFFAHDFGQRLQAAYAREAK